MDKKLFAGSAAEFVGTFALMFVGGAAIFNEVGLIGVALAHGLILAVMVSAVMHISGGQFNPAVSIALAATGKQPWSRAIAFTVAQLAGAVAAAFILNRIFPADASAANAAARIGATLGKVDEPFTLMSLEITATFFLMWVILGTAVDGRGVGKGPHVGGFAIGLCVAANILCFGPLTGASMNPARSFGPALVGGHWDLHWVYWAAPIIGASLAAIAWKVIMEERSA